jgi:hypothetical protein
MPSLDGGQNLLEESAVGRRLVQRTHGGRQ